MASRGPTNLIKYTATTNVPYARAEKMVADYSSIPLETALIFSLVVDVPSTSTTRSIVLTDDVLLA